MKQIRHRSQYKSLLLNGLCIVPEYGSKKTLCGRKTKGDHDYYVGMPGDEPCPVCELEFFVALNLTRLKEIKSLRKTIKELSVTVD